MKTIFPSLAETLSAALRNSSLWNGVQGRIAKDVLFELGNLCNVLVTVTDVHLGVNLTTSAGTLCIEAELQSGKATAHAQLMIPTAKCQDEAIAAEIPTVLANALLDAITGNDSATRDRNYVPGKCTYWLVTQ